MEEWLKFFAGSHTPDANINQSQAGTPQVSDYGNTLRRGLAGGLNDTLRTDTTAQPYKFRGFWGYFSSTPAKVIPVIGRSGGYQGEFPLSQQPYVDKPRPWMLER